MGVGALANMDAIAYLSTTHRDPLAVAHLHAYLLLRDQRIAVRTTVL